MNCKYRAAAAVIKTNYSRRCPYEEEPFTFVPKFFLLFNKIKIAPVSYLNTKPLLWGIEHSSLLEEIEILVDYPSNLARSLANAEIDMALLPVAAIPDIPNARIVSDYGIAADGEVASVAIFSQVPMAEVARVYLDYQSRTSVRLATILLKHFWKKEVEFLEAPKDYIEHIQGTTAAVVIGDRALLALDKFPYIFDLAVAWKDFTGLPFVFAAWVANKDLPQDFLTRFNDVTRQGLEEIDAVVAANPFPAYDLQTYYRRNIHYFINEKMQEGLKLFLKMNAEL